MAYYPHRREGFNNNKFQLKLHAYPSNHSPRLSPPKSTVHMYNLKDFDHFYGVNRPILSKEKKLMIEEKLQLDYQVRRQIENRGRQDSLFVKYLDNPFSKENLNRIVNPIQKFQEQLLKKRRRGKGLNERQHFQQPKSNIIEAINQLQQNKFFKKEQLSLENLKYYQGFSAQIIQNSKGKNYHKLLPEECKIDSLAEEYLCLDDILQMDDQNYYSINQVSINIFQFLKGEHRPFLGSDILNKYYFHYTSMTEKMEKVKFPILRDLSQLGRKLVKGRIMDNSTLLSLILSSETVVKPADLRFEDLLGVASGRFTTGLAYSAVNQEIMRMEFTAEVSELELQDIHYAEGTVNHKQNFVGSGEARQQILDYKQLQNDEIQQKFQNYCKKIHVDVKDELSIKRSLLKNTIKDKNLYNKIDQRVQENIGYLTNMAKTDGGAAADRLIRFNKANKNRKEAILIRNLLNSITLRNREQEKIQELLRAKTSK